jgi:hypothetical protein
MASYFQSFMWNTGQIGFGPETPEGCERLSATRDLAELQIRVSRLARRMENGSLHVPGIASARNEAERERVLRSFRNSLFQQDLESAKNKTRTKSRPSLR